MPFVHGFQGHFTHSFTCVVHIDIPTNGKTFSGYFFPVGDFPEYSSYSAEHINLGLHGFSLCIPGHLTDEAFDNILGTGQILLPGVLGGVIYIGV